MKIRTALTAGVLLLATACAGAQESLLVGAPENSADPRTPVPHQEDIFVSATLSDWVSYSDRLVVLRITAERDLPLDPEVRRSGEGYQGRSVSAVIEEELWTAPNAPSAPSGEFAFNTHGYIFAAGVRREAVVPGSIRLDVGEQYVIPLTRIGDQIGPLTTHSIARLDSGRAVLAPEQRDPVVGSFAGREPSEIRGMAERAEPDRFAVRHRDKAPVERQRAAVADRRATCGPDTSC